MLDANAGDAGHVGALSCSATAGVGNGVLAVNLGRTGQCPITELVSRDQWRETDPKLSIEIDFNAEIPPFLLLQARRLLESECAALVPKQANAGERQGICEAFVRNVEDNRVHSQPHPGDRLFHIRTAQANSNPAYGLLIQHLLGHCYGSMIQHLQAHSRQGTAAPLQKQTPQNTRGAATPRFGNRVARGKPIWTR
ncbi:FCD domain-containing protein [Pseudomonas aeruginosa]|uniref:FCD domain-containing protein n=1 Tax=Pseudomonas aeruginosa TaxID=287 RepID=UPI003FD40DDD